MGMETIASAPLELNVIGVMTSAEFAPAEQTEDGVFFLDRDPSYYPQVLDLFRNPQSAQVAHEYVTPVHRGARFDAIATAQQCVPA